MFYSQQGKYLEVQDLIKKSTFQCLFVLYYSVCVSVKVIRIKNKKDHFILFSLGSMYSTK